jgi:hypothetical protein
MAVLVITTFIPLSEVLAKDVCVGAGAAGIFVFKNIKPLTKPHQFSPLQGVWFNSGAGFVGPFHGQAFVESDGTVNIGIFAHNNIDGVSFQVLLRGTSFDTASGPYDNGPDGVNEGTVTFTGSVDCRTITLP